MLNIPAPENIAIKFDHLDALLTAIADRIQSGDPSAVTEQLMLLAMDINTDASKEFNEYIKSVEPLVDAADKGSVFQGGKHD